MVSTETAYVPDWSFHCTACGKCCNSPPRMSLPELFHHQQRFIGSLGLQRRRRLQAGDRLGALTLDSLAVEDDVALAAQILFPLTGRPDDLILQTQAIASPTLNRCPALQDDGTCQVHGEHKPRTCSVVPLEPLLPDSLQHAVLAARSAGGAEYLGTDCIVHGEAPGFALQTRGAAVVDPAARQTLAKRREDLAQDKRWWGNAIFAELEAEILAQPGRLASIPHTGVTTLPLAPVLLRLARLSTACHQRCQQYVEAQITLISREIEQALQRRNPAERPFTAQLRQWATTLGKLQTTLPHIVPTRHRDTPEIESWLGLSPPTTRNHS